MKIIAKVLVSLVVVSAPAFAFAQAQSAPLTRAQVKAELSQLEQAGYSAAAGDNAHYPDDIQAAEAKVAAQASTNETNEAYGGTHAGKSASGVMQHAAPKDSWSGSSNDCVGPAGFCTPFFGS